MYSLIFSSSKKYILKKDIIKQSKIKSETVYTKTTHLFIAYKEKQNFQEFVIVEVSSLLFVSFIAVDGCVRTFCSTNI